MRICVIGAGALGGSIGARLSAAGEEVTLVDIWKEHVAAINRDGLDVQGVPAAMRVRASAYLPEEAPTGFELVLLATDTNHTGEGAATAARVLRPDGMALTVQNGIGNLELLIEALGRERVLGGSTMCSFRTLGPGRVEQTHMGPTTIGELDGARSERVERLRQVFDKAGYDIAVSEEILTVIWTKFVLNCAINALCATTGLRSGEMVRVEAMDRLQDRVLDEAFAVVRAKGITLPESELRTKIKQQCWLKYNKPSMLQHVEAGRQTEIDALNGALVREAAGLGVPVPYNDALVMLLKGRERARIRDVHEGEIDYARREEQAKHEAPPPR